MKEYKKFISFKEPIGADDDDIWYNPKALFSFKWKIKEMSKWKTLYITPVDYELYITTIQLQ